jgi:hypothetical protein
MTENNPSPMSPIPNDSEAFGKVPNDAESFGRIPNGSEIFRSVPKGSERKESHTLTVREVARMFEAAGVARTERSITNWCQENKLGIARLDAYFDPNERRYFITAQSAQLAIEEEKAKVAKGGDVSEPVGSVPHDAERPQKAVESVSEADAGRMKTLALEIMDLKITNRGKDYFIEQLQKEREGFAEERQGYVQQLINSNRKIGELETKLLQLEAPM